MPHFIFYNSGKIFLNLLANSVSGILLGKFQSYSRSHILSRNLPFKELLSAPSLCLLQYLLVFAHSLKKTEVESVSEVAGANLIPPMGGRMMIFWPDTCRAEEEV